MVIHTEEDPTLLPEKGQDESSLPEKQPGEKERYMKNDDPALTKED